MTKRSMVIFVHRDISRKHEFCLREDVLMLKTLFSDLLKIALVLLNKYISIFIQR